MTEVDRTMGLGTETSSTRRQASFKAYRFPNENDILIAPSQQLNLKCSGGRKTNQSIMSDQGRKLVMDR
jgi:hypothetical protein